MSIQHCNTEHYGIMFKVLDIMPRILRRSQIPYALYGGRAIVKHLVQTAYYVPSTDIWDSIDYDIHTTNPPEMKDYIIDQILELTEIRREQIHVEPRVLPDGKRGLQLSLNICYNIDLPEHFGVEERETGTLQFADIFQAEEPNLFEDYPRRLVQFDQINYEPVESLARGLEHSIRTRNEMAVIAADYTSAEYDARIDVMTTDLNQTKVEYHDALNKYMDLCRRVDADKRELRDLRVEITDLFETIEEYYRLLIDLSSYRTSKAFIDHMIKQLEHYDKVNKLRLRLELVRELLMGRRA